MRIDEARSRFLPKNVDANDVDFSDRVDGKRKSYKVSSLRQRILQDGTEELGDLSDDDDDESLERRVARLQREVQEAKEAFERRKNSTSPPTEGPLQSSAGLDSMSQLLDELSRSASTRANPVSTQPPTVPPQAATGVSDPDMAQATYTLTYTPAYEQSHALAKAADFDRRLLQLEQGLGLSSVTAPEVDEQGLPRAILPACDSLMKQISTLSQASVANLDAISRRVRALAAEQDKFNESREKARQIREELGNQNGDSSGEASEQEVKVNALYGQLPTIESLTPMLPALLDRLRSLRTIHAEAATASETLDRIEKEQVDMTEELKQWRDGLEKIEKAVQEGDSAMKGNAKVMDGWVKELEARIAKLS